MDDARFDALVRTLSRAGSRRRALRALAGAPAAGLLAHFDRGDALGHPRCHPNGETCATDADCCSDRCEQRQGERRGTCRPVAGDAPTAAGPRRKPRQHKKRQGPCRHTEQDRTVITTFTTKLKGQGLSLISRGVTPRNPGDDQLNTTTIKKGRTLLVQVEQTLVATSGRLTIHVTYGGPFQGIHEMVLVVDGGTVTGNVDGRAIVPFPAASPPATLSFQDGQPAPELTVSDQIKQQIEQIVARAQDQQAACASSPPPLSPARAKAQRVGAQDEDQVVCAACKVWCDAKFAVRGVFEALGAIAGGAVGLVAAIPAAVEWANGLEDCLDKCRRSSECCPVLCGTLPDDSCCFGGAQCLTFGTGFGECCLPEWTPCHETTCCAPSETCMDDGSCCASHLACDHGDCCGGGFGERCCGPTCCPAGRDCCGETCCRAGERCCPGGGCCPTGRDCCNGVCCPAGQSCQNGSCAQVCNPTRQVACPNEPGYPTCCERGTLCCQNGECCPFIAPVCCPGSEEGCCLSGQRCCTIQGGAFCASTCER